MTNAGSILVLGTSSDAVFAQSVGESMDRKTLTTRGGLALANSAFGVAGKASYSYLPVKVKTYFGAKDGNWQPKIEVPIEVTFGQVLGGSGGHGGDVEVANGQDAYLVTLGDMSAGIFAQSVGGGGATAPSFSPEALAPLGAGISRPEVREEEEGKEGGSSPTIRG